MSTPILEKMTAAYMATEQPVYTFGWQGGEPTLMGVEFFRKAVAFQKQYGRPGAQVANGLQTNGTRISDELAAFFAEYQFLIGVSIDGPPELHDHYRPYESGRRSHAEVLKGVKRLRAHGVEHNVLTVVNAHTVEHPRSLYRYLKELGFEYHQYIPCVEYEADGSLRPYSIDGPRWGRFLLELYDEWKNDSEPVSVRHFDALMQHALGGPPAMCSLASSCRQYFVVEHNGDVFPCDFFVNDTMRLGNVQTQRFGEMWQSPTFKQFGRMKRVLPLACQECEYLSWCRGDCPKHRVSGAHNPVAALQTAEEPPVSTLCEGWKEFFSQTIPDIERQAKARAGAR